MKAIPVRKAIIENEKNIVNLYGERMATGIENKANKKNIAPRPRLMKAYV